MAKKQKTQVMSYSRYEKWFEQLSKQGYGLNNKMNVAEFNSLRQQLVDAGISAGEVNKSIKQGMFDRSYKQAVTSRQNLFQNLERIRQSANKTEFEQALLEKAAQYGLNERDLSVSDMRKINGKLHQFDDDIQALAVQYKVENWTDQIFGS